MSKKDSNLKEYAQKSAKLYEIKESNTGTHMVTFKDGSKKEMTAKDIPSIFLGPIRKPY